MTCIGCGHAAALKCAAARRSVITVEDRLTEATLSLGRYPKANDVIRYLAGAFPHKPHATLPWPEVVTARGLQDDIVSQRHRDDAITRRHR